MSGLYLDHNATTPVHPEVVAAMLPYFSDWWGNPSSSHPAGRRARHGLEAAREQVAALLGARAETIVFTSGGTEASNLAIVGHAQTWSTPRRVVSSTIEHPATANTVQALGAPTTLLAVGADGEVDLPDRLPDDTGLVTVMLANNETGVIQPIAALGALAREAGATLHSDAAQAVGKIPVDVDALGVDLLTVAGHKLYAPKGIGALYRRSGTPLSAILHGAGHEGGLRPGTENVALAVGLGAACALAAADLEQEQQRQAQLRDRLAHQLLDGIPGIAWTARDALRLPNTLHLTLPRPVGAALLEQAGVWASTGSACHEGLPEPSAVLLAMGMDAERARGALRISLGRSTSREQVDAAATALIGAWQAISPA